MENQLNAFVPLIAKDIGSVIIGSICTSSDLDTATNKFRNMSRVEPKLRRVRGKFKSQNNEVKQKNKCSTPRKQNINRRKSLGPTKAGQGSKPPDMIEYEPKLSVRVDFKNANKKVRKNTRKENVKSGKTRDSIKADEKDMPTNVDECEPKVCLAKGKSKSLSKKVKNGSSNPHEPSVSEGKSRNSMEAGKKIKSADMHERDPKLDCTRDKSKGPNKKGKNKSSIQSTLSVNRGKSLDQTEANKKRKPNYMSECVPNLACSSGNAKKKKRQLATSPAQFTLPADTNAAQYELNLVKQFNLKRVEISVQLLPPDLFEFNSNSIDIRNISHPFEVAVVQSALCKSLLTDSLKHSPAKKRKTETSSRVKPSCASFIVNSSSLNEHSTVPDISVSHTESSTVVENVSSTEKLLGLKAVLEKTSITSMDDAITSNEDLTLTEKYLNQAKHNTTKKQATAIRDFITPLDNDVNVNNCKQSATFIKDFAAVKGRKRDKQTSGIRPTTTEISTKINVESKVEQNTKSYGLTSKTYSTATTESNPTEPTQTQGNQSATSLKRKLPVVASSNKLKGCGLAEVVPRKRSKKLVETLASMPKTGVPVPVSKVVPHQRLVDSTQDTLKTVRSSCIATVLPSNYTEKSNQSDVAKKMINSSIMNCLPWTTASGPKVHMKSLPRIPKFNSSKKIPLPSVHSTENIPLKQASGSGTPLACPDLVKLGSAISQPVKENANRAVCVSSSLSKHVSASGTGNIQMHTESAILESIFNTATSKHSSDLAAITSTSQPLSIRASFKAPVESVAITPVLSISVGKATGGTAGLIPASLDTRTCTKSVSSRPTSKDAKSGLLSITDIVENNNVPAQPVLTVSNIEQQASNREHYESDDSDCISLTAESYMCYTGESKFTSHPINPYNSGNQEWNPSVTTNAAHSISPPSPNQVAMVSDDLPFPVVPTVGEEENEKTIVSDRVLSGSDFCPNFRAGTVCSSQLCFLKHELPEVATMDGKQVSFLLTFVKHYPPLYDSLIIELAKHLYKKEALYNGHLWRIFWQEFQPTWGVTNDRYTIVLEKTVSWCKQGQIDYNFIDCLFDLMCQSDNLHPMWRDLTHIEGYNYPIYVAEKLIHICLSNVADKEFATYAITSVLAQVIPTNYCLLNKPLVNEFQLMLSQNYPDLHKLLSVFIDRSNNTAPVKGQSFPKDVPLKNKNICQSLFGNYPTTSVISREIPVPTMLPVTKDVDLLVPSNNRPYSSPMCQDIPSPINIHPKSSLVPDNLPVNQVSALWLASQDAEVEAPVCLNTFQHSLGPECTTSINNVGELLDIPELHRKEHEDFNRLYDVDDAAYFPQDVTFPSPRRPSTAGSALPGVCQPLVPRDNESVFEAMSSGRLGDIVTLLYKGSHTAAALQIANKVCSYLIQEPSTCSKVFERLVQCAVKGSSGCQSFGFKIDEILSTIGMNMMIQLAQRDLFMDALSVMKIMTANRLALITYEVFDQTDIISPAQQTIICSQVYMRNYRVEDAISLIASSKMFLPSSLDWTMDSRGEPDVLLRNRYCEDLLLVAINSKMAKVAFNMYVAIQQAQDCDNMPIDVNKHSSQLMLELLNAKLPMEALYVFSCNSNQLLITHQWLVRGLLISLSARHEEEKAHSLYEAALSLNIYPRIPTDYKPVRITVFSNWHTEEIAVVLKTFLGRLVCDDNRVPGITIFIEVKRDLNEGALVPKVLESVDPTVKAVTCRLRYALLRMNLKTQCPLSSIDKDISLTSESVLKYLQTLS